MSDPSNSWLPVLTALGGFLTGAITEYLRDRRARAREREAREAARQLQLSERRTDFQRVTLLSLQDAVLELARMAGRMHHLDEMEYRKTGKWGGHLFPADLDNGAREAGVRTLTLMVRVRDDSIREMMKTFRDHANRVGVCRSREEGFQEMEGMVAALESFHERIGLILRKLDDDEESSELRR